MSPFLIFTFKNNIRFAKLSLAFIWKNPFTGVPLLTCSSRHASTTSAACGARLTCPKMPEFITTLMTTIQSQWQLDGARSTDSSDKRRDSFKDFGTWDKVLRRGHLQDIQIKVNKVFYDELFILKPPRPDTVKHFEVFNCQTHRQIYFKILTRDLSYQAKLHYCPFA